MGVAQILNCTKIDTIRNRLSYKRNKLTVKTLLFELISLTLFKILNLHAFNYYNNKELLHFFILLLYFTNNTFDIINIQIPT